MGQPFRLFLILAVVLVGPALRAAELPTEQVERALRGTEIAPLFSLVDTSRLADRASLDEAAVRAFDRAREHLGEQRFNRYRLYTRDEQLLLRIDLAPRGLNWLELSWHKARGDTPLDDWHDHALGIRLSELVAGVAMLAEGSDGRRFLEAVSENPRRAWRRLDERSRRNPAAPRLFWIACDSQDCQVDALEALEQLDDPDPALWKLDLAAARQDRGAFTETMEALRDRLGPDPGLVWLTAAEALGQGDCDAVVHDVQDAMTEWPDYQPLYPVMIQCLVEREQYRQALQFFGVLEEHFGVQMDWPSLQNHPVYGKLLESEVFREWKEGR